MRELGCLLAGCDKEKLEGKDFCSKKHFYEFHNNRIKGAKGFDAFKAERDSMSNPGMYQTGSTNY